MVLELDFINLKQVNKAVKQTLGGENLLVTGKFQNPTDIKILSLLG